MKSLYFNLAYVFLFSAKTRIYKQNTHTHTQSGAENSLFQVCLTITKLFSPFDLRETANYLVSQLITNIILKRKWWDNQSSKWSTTLNWEDI